MQPGDPRPPHTNARATNALHSVWRNQGWNRRTVGRVHWQVESALAHRRGMQIPIAVSAHPVPDRHPMRHAAAEEGTGAPDWRTPKERRATGRRSISRYPPNDERERAQPFIPNWLRKNCPCTRELQEVARLARRENTHPGCSKSSSGKAAASEGPRRYKPHFVWAVRPYNRSW